MRRTVWSLLAAWLLQLLLASSGWALVRVPTAHTPTPTQAPSTHTATHTATRPHNDHPCHGATTPSAVHTHGEQDAHAVAQPSGGPGDHGSELAHAGLHSHSPHSGGEGHHCCAVGLGLGVPPLLSPLPQAAPRSVARGWDSLKMRPDLRPPI